MVRRLDEGNDDNDASRPWNINQFYDSLLNVRLINTSDDQFT